MVGENTQWLDPTQNLHTAEVLGGHQAFPKQEQHLLLFPLPLPSFTITTQTTMDRNEIQNAQIHSLFMLTEREQLLELWEGPL